MNSESNIIFTKEFNNSKTNTELHIILTTDEDDFRPIYITGNFNDWCTQDKLFMMERVGKNSYHYKFPHDFDYPSELLYKFTKGDWGDVEIDTEGNATENRSTNKHRGIQNEHVARWKKNELSFKQNYLPQVLLISDEFEIPQLNKTRKIWALLPHDYDATNENYPVLYLHDAQNLFNEESQFGNWEIDKKLALMSEYKIGKIIVIAIEHAEEERIQEYNVGKTILGKGQGKKYIRFVTNTLKPFVDSNFRTKKEREFTGIGGSSMGGLVSVFSGLMYPEIYGKLMVFSPSLWVVPKLKVISEDAVTEDTKIYLYAGGDENETMIEHVNKFKDNMIASDFVKDKMIINISINMEGKHSEKYWGEEFPKAIEWLFLTPKTNKMKTKNIHDLNNFSGTILIPVFETNPKNIIPIVFEGLEISSKVFHGKKDTCYLAENKGNTFIFIGLGKSTDYKSLKTIFRRVASKEKDNFGNSTALFIPEQFGNELVEAAVSGLLLGTYNLGHYKKKEEHPFLHKDYELEILSKTDFSETIKKAIKIAHAQLEALFLVDLPPNIVTPKYMANWARDTGGKYGFEVEVLGFEASKIIGLGAFLAVGKGSENEPQFIILDYTPKKAVASMKHVGLVGKGITFDTGGLNIKTSAMVQMKCDMAGGAAVLCAMQLIADLQLPIKVTAIIPCAENSVDSKSFLPGDVIHSYSGHSIEIIDTDAEGRLVLADGLSYLIKNFKPEYIVDIATLTGSCVSTFGFECAAMFTNNENIAKKLQQTGDAIGERLWPLPLWEAYKQDIESDIADVKNYSGKPVAGAISAAKFLEYFTHKHPAWAHLDIAGVAFGDDELAKSKHATGYGVYLLTKFIESLSI